VLGGGGIVPDVIVRDTLTQAERSFIASVSRKAATFTEVVSRYAIEYERRTPNLAPDFAVTPTMRAELYNRLRAAGVEVTPELYAGAQRWLDYQVASQIAQSRFGRETAAERAGGSDRVLQQAVRFLQGASSQAALFQAAQSLLPVATAPR
jgi:carboxyl-terminal processing protease